MSPVLPGIRLAMLLSVFLTVSLTHHAASADTPIGAAPDPSTTSEADAADAASEVPAASAAAPAPNTEAAATGPAESASPAPAAKPPEPSPLAAPPPAPAASAPAGDAPAPNEVSVTVQYPPGRPHVPEERFEVTALLLGASSVQADSLAERLARNGYERPRRGAFAYGAELRSTGPRGGVIGGTFLGTLGGTRDGPDGLETHIQTFMGTLDIGHTPVQLKHFDLALIGGIGWYALRLEVEDVKTQPFDQVLANPPRAVEFSMSGLLLGGSLELHVKTLPFVYGLRLSSYWGPQLGGWDLPSAERATGGPKGGVKTTTLSLVFGLER